MTVGGVTQRAHQLHQQPAFVGRTGGQQQPAGRLGGSRVAGGGAQPGQRLCQPSLTKGKPGSEDVTQGQPGSEYATQGQSGSEDATQGQPGSEDVT